MYKVAWTVRFAAGVSVDDARGRWSGEHAALARSVPGVERYVQSHSTASLGLTGVDSDRPAFDGYECLWFADRGRFEAARESPEWSAMLTDGARLFDPDSTPSRGAAVEEHTIVDGPADPFKAVWFVLFKAAIRADANQTGDAHRRWTATHGGEFGAKVPGIGRYVQNHVVEPLEDGAVPPFDGFSECWFADRAAFDLTMGSKEWGEMNEDASVDFDRDWIVGGMSALLDEVVVET